MSLLISQLGLKQNALHGETVIVTGAGEGVFISHPLDLISGE